MLFLVTWKHPSWELNLSYPNVDADSVFSVYFYKDITQESAHSDLLHTQHRYSYTVALSSILFAYMH